MKKILGLIASERQFGNNELMVKEIMNHIPEPCSREMIRLTDMNISACKACYRCLNPDTPCKINDDFSFVLNKIKEADALILGVAVYFLGPHSSYVALTNRMLGAGHYAEYTRNKPCIIVTPHGILGWEGYSKAAVLNLPRFLEMKIIDFWQIQAALPGESLLTPENREYAKTLGQGLFEKEEYAKSPFECTRCGSDAFRLLPGNRIECALCASKGNLSEEGVPVLDSGDYRFSTEALQDHFKVELVDLLIRYMVNRDQLKAVQKPYRKLNWWVKPGEDDPLTEKP